VTNAEKIHDFLKKNPHKWFCDDCLEPQNKWTTLASAPQSALFPASAVYKGQLYCIGGWAASGGPVIGNAQIYQP